MKKQVKIYAFSQETEPKSKTLPEEVFGVKENQTLVARMVKVFLANQRRSKAKAKARGEVDGSGKKIWRQKGTGRARHGDRYAPIFVGGGVTHGPTGKENWKLNLPKKQKTKALAVCLSQKLAEGEIIFVADLKKLEGKTNQAAKLLTQLLERTVDLKKKLQPQIALISKDNEEKLRQTVRNLDWVELTTAGNLSPFQVLTNKFLIIEETAVEPLVTRIDKK